jgi:UDP-N-acetylglucosamine--N-acetylmuramyl-(pentapeptide) pyrophosphoryl-undecaprenol N-acetylglucosamine transferase
MLYTIPARVYFRKKILIEGIGYMEKSICFTGGGTGGHVFPGIAIIDELEKRFDGRIFWVGSNKGMEQEIVQRRGIEFFGVPSGKLRRYVSLENFIDVGKVFAGVIASLVILARERPALVFSKGGYVSVPVVVAAGILKIPVYTHESDYDPGMATKINSRVAEKILTSFADTRSFFKGPYFDKVVHTGNPIRLALAAGDPSRGRKRVGCEQGRKVVLVLGGSLGAAALNNAILESLDALAPLCFVVHQTGAKHFTGKAGDGYFSSPFFKEELPDIIACADLVVCRAGSNTLWELAASGKPSVLVPLPAAGSRGDQIRNASVFEAAGASLVVKDDQSLSVNILEIIRKLIDNDDTLARMGSKARAISMPDAALSIAGMIYDRTKGE